MIDYKDLIRLKEKTGIPEETIEKDYLIELLLSYIPVNDYLKSCLIFRGGTALKKVFFPQFRYSEDLDFIVKPGGELKNIQQNMKELLNMINESWPVEISWENALYPQRGHLQLFVSYNIVSEIRTAKELKIDIIKDNTILNSEFRKILFTYRDFLRLHRRINTYDLESITAEKILRIIDVVDEPRDLWDLLYLLKSEINPELIKKAFVKKTGYKIDAAFLISAIKRPDYQKLWKIRLKSQLLLLPEYSTVVNELEFLIQKFFT